jgi:hypothetical protein
VAEVAVVSWGALGVSLIVLFVNLFGGQSAKRGSLHSRIDQMEKAMPKDYVPRLELNGRLDGLKIGQDDIKREMREGFASSRAQHAGLEASIRKLLARRSTDDNDDEERA